MIKHICLHGITQKVIKKHNLCRIEKYASRYECILHSSCVAVPCEWPLNTIQDHWQSRNTCRSDLIKEATRCFKCNKVAKYLCVYGGHMVCETHLSNTPKKIRPTKIQSSFYCCGPVWPNPFSYMYISDDSEVLENNIIGNLCSYKLQKLQLPKSNAQADIKLWAHKHDFFPRLEIIKPFVTEKYLCVWRIAFKSQPTLPLVLQRCPVFWVSSFIQKSLHHLLQRYKTIPSGGSLFIHQKHFYMHIQFPQDNKIQCLVCQQQQSYYEFEKSFCALYPLNEMILFKAT
jgi:hypothetical protein